MAYNHHLISLDNFIQEDFYRLDIVFYTAFMSTSEKELMKQNK